MTSSLICPFTLNPIADIPTDKLAFVYHPNTSDACGCCTLSNLIAYLHDDGGARECSVCRASIVGAVYDGCASLWIRQQKRRENQQLNTNSACSNDAVSDGSIVSFKYGTVTYHLWVMRHSIALKQTGSVMGIAVNNMKIIFKGKIIYPNNTSIIEASEQILDISNTDFIHQRKKASLILMGSRQSPANNVASVNSVYALVWYAVYNIQLCIQFMWHGTGAILSGIYIFVRSVLHPPDARGD